MNEFRGVQIGERDLAVLSLLAENRAWVVPQVATLLGVSAEAAGRRLRRLADRGLTGYERIFSDAPATVWIRRPGLEAIGSPLAPPRVDLKGYRHDVGVGWLILGARTGLFGQLSAIVSEREMRSRDARGSGRPFGVGIGGVGPTGLPQRHYPDLLLRTGAGRTVAVELELSGKSQRRLDGIMRGYASEPRIDSVLYVVPDRRLGDRIAAAARRAGIGDQVQVQILAGAGIEGAGPARELGRGSRSAPARAVGRPGATRPAAEL